MRVLGRFQIFSWGVRVWGDLGVRVERILVRMVGAGAGAGGVGGLGRAGQSGVCRGREAFWAE